MNLLLGLSLLLAFSVMFIHLCKLDTQHPIRLFSVLLQLFGVVMVYGFVFEIGLIDFDLLKAGLISLLIGASIWFMVERRKL